AAVLARAVGSVGVRVGHHRLTLDQGAGSAGRTGPALPAPVSVPFARVPERELGAVAQVELAQRVGDVVAYGALGDEEAFGDLPVGGTLADELRDLGLPLRQRSRGRRGRGRGGGGVQGPDDPVRDRTRQYPFAPCGTAQHIGDLVRFGVLEQVS